MICFFDYGASITLNDGESVILDFDTGGIYQLL